MSKDKVSPMINNVLDDNVKFRELSSQEQFLRIIKDDGKYDDDNVFGTEDSPSILYSEAVHDDVKCENCGNKTPIHPSDVPKILRFYENISNGIGTSLRALKRLGLLFEKDGKTLIFKGFGNKPTKYPSIPAKVRLHYEDLVSKGDQRCDGCKVLFYGKALDVRANYEIDHLDSVNYDKYLNSDSFRHNTKNYQLLCRICNPTKREMDRVRRGA